MGLDSVGYRKLFSDFNNCIFRFYTFIGLLEAFYQPALILFPSMKML